MKERYQKTPRNKRIIIKKHLKNSANPDPLLNTIEAAKYLSQAPETLPAWRHRSVGPDYIKIGRNVRYKLSALDAYLERQTVRVGR